jgi:hypothetical protein
MINKILFFINKIKILLKLFKLLSGISTTDYSSKVLVLTLANDNLDEFDAEDLATLAKDLRIIANAPALIVLSKGQTLNSMSIDELEHICDSAYLKQIGLRNGGEFGLNSRKN